MRKLVPIVQRPLKLEWTPPRCAAHPVMPQKFDIIGRELSWKDNDKEATGTRPEPPFTLNAEGWSEDYEQGKEVLWHITISPFMGEFIFQKIFFRLP